MSWWVLTFMCFTLVDVKQQWHGELCDYNFVVIDVDIILLLLIITTTTTTTTRNRRSRRRRIEIMSNVGLIAVWVDLMTFEFVFGCCCNRIESTREMCNLLKNFAASTAERVDKCKCHVPFFDSNMDLWVIFLHHETLTYVIATVTFFITLCCINYLFSAWTYCWLGDTKSIHLYKKNSAPAIPKAILWGSKSSAE